MCPISSVQGRKLKSDMLFCFSDKRYETVILPMFGAPCPYHISTVKVWLYVILIIECHILKMSIIHIKYLVGYLDTDDCPTTFDRSVFARVDLF